MYTLHLKDIDLDPKITADKSFEDASEDGVINLAVNYINDTYKDTYNPYTLQRKCADALLHDGVTLASESKAHLDSLNQKWDENEKSATAQSEEKFAQYEQQSKAVYAKYDDLKSKLSEKLDVIAKDANFDTDSDQYKKAQEEYLQGKESLEWQQDKELKALYPDTSETT